MAERKTQNYTDEQVDRMLEVYDPEANDEQREEQVQQLATEFDKSVRSVRAKLAREGVYVAKSRGNGNKRRTTKGEQVETIAHAIGVEKDQLATLEKANKVELARLMAGITDVQNH